LIAVLLEKLTFINGLIALALFLFIGFVSLIIYQLNKLEDKIKELKDKFIRADELIDIKKDIEAFKLLKLIKR